MLTIHLSFLLPLNDYPGAEPLPLGLPGGQDSVPRLYRVPLGILVIDDVEYKCVLVLGFIIFPMFTWTECHQKLVRQNLKKEQ